MDFSRATVVNFGRGVMGGEWLGVEGDKAR